MSPELLQVVKGMSREQVIDTVVAYMAVTGDVQVIRDMLPTLVRWMNKEGATLKTIGLYLQVSERKLYRLKGQKDHKKASPGEAFVLWLKRHGACTFDNIVRLWMRRNTKFNRASIETSAGWIAWMVKMGHIYEHKGRYSLEPVVDGQVHLLELIKAQPELPLKEKKGA